MLTGLLLLLAFLIFLRRVGVPFHVLLGRSRGSWSSCPPPLSGRARPDGLTQKFALGMKALNIGGVTVHSMRHTHASQLIAAGMDVLTISRRLGHGSPVITLKTYGHLFGNTDAKAAEIMERTFQKLTE